MTEHATAEEEARSVEGQTGAHRCRACLRSQLVPGAHDDRERHLIALIGGVEQHWAHGDHALAVPSVAAGEQVEQFAGIVELVQLQGLRRQRCGGPEVQVSAPDGTERALAERHRPDHIRPEAEVVHPAVAVSCADGVARPTDDRDALPVRGQQSDRTDRVVDDDRVEPERERPAQRAREQLEVLRPICAGQAEHATVELLGGAGGGGERIADRHDQLLTRGLRGRVAFVRVGATGAADGQRRAVRGCDHGDRLRAPAIDSKDGAPATASTLAAGGMFMQTRPGTELRGRHQDRVHRWRVDSLPPAPWRASPTRARTSTAHTSR